MSAIDAISSLLSCYAGCKDGRAWPAPGQVDLRRRTRPALVRYAAFTPGIPAAIDFLERLPKGFNRRLTGLRRGRAHEGMRHYDFPSVLFFRFVSDHPMPVFDHAGHVALFPVPDLSVTAASVCIQGHIRHEVLFQSASVHGGVRSSA